MPANGRTVPSDLLMCDSRLSFRLPGPAGSGSSARSLQGLPPGLFRVLGVVMLWLLMAGPLGAASNDGSVEWNGVYSDKADRAPLNPARGEAFTVELRVFQWDITGAKVRVFDGEVTRYDMYWVRNEGQYDIWQATIGGSQSDYLYYRYEISDGGDTDYYNRLGMSADVPASGDFFIDLTVLGPFPLGATVDGGGAVFRVWAPNATAVSVAGEFNGWSTSASPMDNVRGFWQARVVGAASGDEYKFVIENEGTHWRADPRARRQVNSVGASILHRSDYPWGDTGWQTPPFEEMIIYELHVGTFSGEGDGVNRHPAQYRDVVDAHLDHLVGLGINVVQLMPICEFSGDLSWGYNPVFLFSPEEAYGDPDDLKYLVDRCHRAGLAVILDVVFNHMGANDLAGNVLEYDGEEIYFYPEGNGYRNTPWGPRPDYGRSQVREFLTDSLRHWLEEYRFDGFRVDGTDFIKVNMEGWRLLGEIGDVVDGISRKAIVIGEQLPNDPAVTVSRDAGGAGLDSQWNDGFHDGLRDALGAAAFGDPDMGRLVAGMNHFAFGGVKAVNYIESHDEANVHGRAVEVADGASRHSEYAYGRGKLVYGLTMFTAGIPMILQGQEWMEDRRFHDAAANRIQWGYKQAYRDYYLACRDMTWLRRSAPALRADGNQNIFHVNEGASVVGWHRWTGSGEDLVIVASFNNNDFNSYCIGMPRDGVWHEVFNSDASVYGGRNTGNGGQVTAGGAGRDGLPSGACITLPRMGVVVLAKDPVNVVRDDDADNDLVPDEWEREHGFNPNNPIDGGVDRDQDRFSTYEEYVAGTDPNVAASHLRVRSVTRSGDVTTLVFDSVAGRLYRIQAAPAVSGSAFVEVGTVSGTGGEISHDDVRLVGRVYYRLEVELE